MEIVELADHPFFLATQFHPEFKSRPLRPSPPFFGFVQACAGQFQRRPRVEPSRRAKSGDKPTPAKAGAAAAAAAVAPAAESKSKQQ